MRKMTFIVGYWPRRQRYFTSRSKVSLFLLGLICACGILFCVNIFNNGQASVDQGIIADASFAELDTLINDLSLSDNTFKAVFNQGLPMLKLQDAEFMSPVSIAASLLQALTTVDLEDPKGLLESQFSYMEEMEIEAVSIPYKNTETAKGATEEISQLAPEHQEGDASGEDNQAALNENGGSGQQGQTADSSGDNPLAGIYTTHNAETYYGEKKPAKSEGTNAGVMRVAVVLETALRDKYNIAAARSEQIHDYPDWNLSYTKSKETAKSLLSKNPSIQVLLDIHRDAGVKEKQTVVINGRSAAKVLIIVGSAQRLENPNWKKNKEFADKVNAKMNELYPDLSRGVRVQSGRYNQHLHPHAILLEMGNAKNSLAEAEVSAGLMAHVISEVLKDISANKL